MRAKGDLPMKKFRMLLAVLCTLSFSACGSSDDNQAIDGNFIEIVISDTAIFSETTEYYSETDTISETEIDVSDTIQEIQETEDAVADDVSETIITETVILETGEITAAYTTLETTCSVTETAENVKTTVNESAYETDNTSVLNEIQYTESCETTANTVANETVTAANDTAAEKNTSSIKTNAATVVVPDESESEGNLVWVPTNGGKKYHTKSSCSQMIDPIQVSLETAEENGYTPCGRCYK